MTYGFVYVLGNQSMPSIYKVGFTLKHPKERMEELSRATACPTVFTLLAYFGCDCPQDVERDIHDELAQYRVNSSREFFKIDATLLLSTIRTYFDVFEDAVFDGPLDTEAFIENKLLAAEWKRSYFLEQCADPISWPRKRGFE